MGDVGAGRSAAEAVARRSYGKLVAYIASRTRDVAGAEDALSEAFAAALVDWGENGAPQNPEAWLLTVARRKAADSARRQASATRAEPQLVILAEELTLAAQTPDDRLQLMFACAHPAIEMSVRAPLILQTILGFSAADIASAFLVAPSAMGQRLVRAKSKIKDAGIAFRIPERDELPARLEAVLDALYATFAAGWSAPAGAELSRRALAEEGVWLAQLVASLLPAEPEALGLLSLMLHVEARHHARRDAAGEYVPLSDQDVSLWDDEMIDDADALLRRASALNAPGRYQLEAAVQSAHAVRRETGRADWPAIEKIYDGLLAVTGSPVVAINRAVAISQTRGAQAGWEALQGVADDPRITDYQPYWAARGDLLARIGENELAAEALGVAIGLESDPAIRRFLQNRRAALA